MDWEVEASMAGRAIVASLLGALVGWERERNGHEAGTRTCGLVALGSCVFGMVSTHTGGGDPGRIAAQIVTGIGFLGAGIILHDQRRVIGLTTAATVWGVAAVGLAVAYSMFVLSVVATVIMLGLLAIRKVPVYQELIETKEERDRHATSEPKSQGGPHA